MNIKNKISAFAAAFLLLTSCQVNEYGEVDLTMPEETIPEGTYVFKHPCTMYTQTDFDRVANNVKNNTLPTPSADELAFLKSNQFTNLNYVAKPHVQIVRGDPKGTDEGVENYGDAMRDAAAAYQDALLWKVTGDDQYAAKTLEILSAWAKINKIITSNDSNHMLAAGAQGFTFAAAAEMLYGYAAMSESQYEEIKLWIKTVFAPKNYEFIKNHSNLKCGAVHYWSNWDLVNMISYLQIGILCEDQEMVKFIVDYFYHGDSNGALDKLVRGHHVDPLGTGEEIYQNQESGRDQGHASMSLAVSAQLCQMAWSLYQSNEWNKFLDFFAADNNFLMKMGEYMALSNLRTGTDNKNQTGTWIIDVAKMPFTEYSHMDCIFADQRVTHTKVADDSGRGAVRPGWEIIINHYKNVLGLTGGYLYSKQMADKIRPELGTGDSRYSLNSGGFDQVGWNTLMLYQE